MDTQAPTPDSQSATGSDSGWSATDYRGYVGPKDQYDLVAAMQFNLLTALGLRDHHYLLDIGCGSLRAGRLFIPYLLPEHYCGIEPNQWLIEEGLAKEIGRSILEIKKPQFYAGTDFRAGQFQCLFDYIIAQSIFTHCAKSQIDKCMFEVRQVMHQSSLFVATFRQGADDYSGDQWSYPSPISYTLKTIQYLAAHNDLAMRCLNWRHVHGHDRGTRWLAFHMAGEQPPRLAEDILTLEQKVSALETELHDLRQELNNRPAIENTAHIADQPTE